MKNGKINPLMSRNIMTAVIAIFKGYKIVCLASYCPPLEYPYPIQFQNYSKA